MRGLIVSKSLLDFFVEPGTEGTVYNTFSRSCNMRFGNNLIGIVSEDIGVNPFSIVISGDEFFSWKNRIQRGMKVVFYSDEIRIGSELCLDLRTSSVWDPSFLLELGKENTDRSVNILTNLFSSLEGTRPVLDITQEYFQKGFLYQLVEDPYCEPFVRILCVLFEKEEFSEPSFEDAICGLIGFGKGLTPSGDDFLSGLVGILNIADKRAYLSHDLVSVLSKLNRCLEDSIQSNKTTLISNMLLQSALNGWFSEKVSNFLLALLEQKNDIRSHLDEVLSIGHHSGSDILAGIYTGFQLLNKRNTLCQIQ
ncbi:MAG: hypothetical protein ACI9S8_000389 [Chlamydiales bacterium]|jgi:hypothetical protein